MPIDYLHNHKEFANLLSILETETGIIPQLIEKDYWIMHVMYGLKQQGSEFELKGGTSLSKGYKIIDRFSEDIDIHIKPSSNLTVETNPKKTKPSHVQSRKDYYDWLAANIKIDGIVSVERDEAFDNKKTYNSGGIRLKYQRVTSPVTGMKDGILLELGFDTVTPNNPLTISSWAFDKAEETKGVEIKDNRAIDVLCYSPSYTFVEKLQTIVTKFRKEEESKEELPNLMRQYYDIYSLLGIKEVRNFIGTQEYLDHKAARLSNADLKVPLNENEAFKLSNAELRSRFIQRYKATSKLYYNGQPEFETLLTRIHEFLDRF
ncbi:MAG: nucleotidyl transferase AbiEii/AbiGii toxin family protein [Bacteroidetes bacterium]|nr:nucleotidyl transferase AbiEii/AbiGii toxin family protein [Bacteroidota bacterium]